MLVGSESESYRTLRYLVERLRVMIAPTWLSTKTQPIGIDDTLAYLALAPEVPASAGRTVEIGGPDVLRTPRCSTPWQMRSAGARARGSACRSSAPGSRRCG
jgi:uncharacterized protein YbjT (DUF2867 family)